MGRRDAFVARSRRRRVLAMQKTAPASKDLAARQEARSGGRGWRGTGSRATEESSAGDFHGADEELRSTMAPAAAGSRERKRGQGGRERKGERR